MTLEAWLFQAGTLLKKIFLFTWKVMDSYTRIIIGTKPWASSLGNSCSELGHSLLPKSPNNLVDWAIQSSDRYFAYLLPNIFPVVEWHPSSSKMAASVRRYLILSVIEEQQQHMLHTTQILIQHREGWNYIERCGQNMASFRKISVTCCFYIRDGDPSLSYTEDGWLFSDKPTWSVHLLFWVLWMCKLACLVTHVPQ